jgi:CheY-like chemotaxis protein
MNELGEGKFDLIVTDINMPDMDGIELILAIQERAPELPIIAVSGGGVISAESLLEDAKGLGAVDIVPKPFKTRELLALIEKNLG